MTTRLIDLDTGATTDRYHYTRTVEINDRTIRARIERGIYNTNSGALAEVRTGDSTWSTLVADGINNWWYDTPQPSPDVDAATVLSPLADQVLRKATGILASPPVMPTLSLHLYGAISALLATSSGFNGEVRIDPDDITWAYAHGGALHVIEHPDGSVTFTKSHREDCPYLITAGAHECDGDCDFPHPARR